jgi:hypothetical protein
VALHVDPTDGLGGGDQVVLRRVKPLLPDRTFGLLENELRLIARTGRPTRRTIVSRVIRS